MNRQIQLSQPTTHTIQQVGLGVLLTLKIWSINFEPVLAQSITAAPDGTGTVITIDGNTYHIEGGTQSGTNLFHSFQEFGLKTGEIADFFSQPNIINIFGRVTGGNASIIDGLIQANPNLYLMNPAGIVFGTNAQLNVGGDFFATTADQICFEDVCFNSVGLNDYASLQGNPTIFGFLQSQPGSLINVGTLEVIKGKSIHLSGGTVVNLGQIVAPGGNSTIAAIPGERQVRLSQPGNLLSVEITDEVLTTGIDPLALPELLATTPEHLQAKVVSAPLGNIAIGGEITAEHIDLYAIGQVTPNEPNLVQGDIQVIRFSETGENPDQAVFIDRRTDNPEALLYGAEAGTVAQIIEKDEKGIAVVSEQLTVISDVVGELESVAIVAEGNAGNFWLGSQWLHSETIADYQQQLQTWSNALNKKADILLYSCFTALGATGEALVAAIANITGADVAASVDLTGSNRHSGNWDLEASTGSIEASHPFTAQTLTQWDSKLATLTVQNAGDNLTVDGSLTLREALQAANSDSLVDGQIGSGTDTIRFDTGGVFATAQTITTALGEFTISDDLVIEGTGQSRLAISGGGTNRVFDITNADVTLRNLTVQNGNAALRGGGIRQNSSTNRLTLEQVNLIGNSAGFLGGGIYATNDVTVTNSTVSSNSALIAGGGIYTTASGLITVTNSTVSGNSAGNLGGGISAFNDVTVTSSTVLSNLAGNQGGGISVRNGTTTITNSTVSGNSAGSRGGGIYALNGATTITNSMMSGNLSGNNGGALFNDRGAVTLTNSTVLSNSVGDFGGGIHVRNGAMTVSNSTVSGNSTGVSGGGIYALYDAIIVTNSTVSGNSAGSRGGGISARYGATVANSTISSNSAGSRGGGISALNGATVTNSTVSGNSTGSSGGGISTGLSAATVTNSTVSSNSAGGGGGGISALNGAIVTNSTISSNSARIVGGGIYARDGAIVTNSTISSNSADNNGGGIYTRNSATTVTNSTISSNSAGNEGGGIFQQSNQVDLLNATIAFNQANLGGGLAVNGTQAHSIINTIIANNSGHTPDINADLSTSTISHSLIQRTAGIVGTTLTDGINGNIIGQDPLLAPLANNGGSTQTHALLPGSPALNAGDNNAVNVSLDQRGQLRILHNTVDIGAFESPLQTGLIIKPPNLDLQPLESLNNALAALELNKVSRDRVSDLLANNQICEAVITLDQLHTQTIEQHLGRFESRKPMTCAEMQQRLPDDAVLLYIFAQTDKLHLITLR
ncbi:MAG: DUF4347 domain-containing protein, partial [Spirulina sp. SIO3F2]|nr:DUF4347 domain-containing protein [Spirulina sp. SIO3F2]